MQKLRLPAEGANGYSTRQEGADSDIRKVERTQSPKISVWELTARLYIS